ncbi:MAG: response regulator [Rhodocyclales bacterium]|nr:response regulator [Rhodocyclales bacterium]
MTKILVADDDRVVLFTLAEGLREAGFEVIEAHDGLRALAVCQSEAPALALLDIRMPGLGGLELARRLRDETTVPFLFLSAYGDKDLVQRAVEIGALGYLIKPLQVTAIVPTLRAALARAQDLSGLKTALSSNRTIATAVGMVMRAEGLDQQTAFERLRQQARTQRCRLEDLARAMVEGDHRQEP